MHFLFKFLGLLRRCFSCRSRGELGSCKDLFAYNVTQAESEPGVEAVPCASGWCGKILETENALKEGLSFLCMYLICCRCLFVQLSHLHYFLEVFWV